jgi:DNA repair protein RadC
MYEWQRHEVRVVKGDNTGGEVLNITGDLSMFQAFRAHAKDVDAESWWVIAANAAGDVIGIQELYRGNVSGCPIRLSEVFRMPMLLNATSLSVVHNHPSEKLIPSEEDIQLTKDIYKASKLLDIDFQDHLIVSGDDHESIRKLSILGHIEEIWERDLSELFPPRVEV